MSTHVNHSQNTDNAKSNGEVVEAETRCTYMLDDFSQRAINHGQRKINYELTVVDRKIARALETLKDAIKATPGVDQAQLGAFENAITAVYEASRKVASIVPPGCDPPGDPNPPDPAVKPN